MEGRAGTAWGEGAGEGRAMGRCSGGHRLLFIGPVEVLEMVYPTLRVKKPRPGERWLSPAYSARRWHIRFQGRENGAWFLLFPNQLSMIWPRMDLNAQGCLDFELDFLHVFQLGRPWNWAGCLDLPQSGLCFSEKTWPDLRPLGLFQHFSGFWVQGARCSRPSGMDYLAGHLLTSGIERKYFWESWDIGYNQNPTSII